MRDDRDIQRPKPASAPEKGRGPHCGKARRSATVCPCRHVPMCPHLARNPRESVTSVLSRFPPATVFLRKRSRCLFPPSTWHGIPAKACQVSFSASHLARYPRKSVPGVLFRLPPGTVSTQKCTRCPFPPPIWHGIHAKVYQVSFSASHLTRNPRKSVSGVLSLLPTWHGNPAKAFQVACPAFHLAQFPCESVSGSTSCLPPGTVSLRKRVR